MPVQGIAQDVASAKQILIGNLKELYRIVRSRNFTVTRGFATGDFEADLSSLKATQRLTGGVLAGQGFAFLTNSAT
jgi:HK97 family phage major capsid protein